MKPRLKLLATKKTNLSDTFTKKVDFEPVHFLRCHSKNNDCSDVQTQIWNCAFEPSIDDPKKTTHIVATCGGSSICFINIDSGEVFTKYCPKDVKEIFYSLAWTIIGEITLLATGGVRNTLHLIHPAANIAFLQYNFKGIRYKYHINSILFHPEERSILFCGTSDGDVRICHIGSPVPPKYAAEFNILQHFSAESEIFSLSFCSATHTLLAGCNDGLRGWCLKSTELKKYHVLPELIVFSLPVLHERDDGHDLVDSVESLSNGIVATKCALHSAIYLWNLQETLLENSYVVKPTHVLRWSNTDNYFMFMGADKGSSLLCCGDDQGALWIYDISSLPDTNSENPKLVDPVNIIPWPTVTDHYSDKKRKLSLDVYEIVVDKVAVSNLGEYIVAVTNNNMVCIWKRLL